MAAKMYIFLRFPQVRELRRPRIRFFDLCSRVLQVRIVLKMCICFPRASREHFRMFFYQVHSILIDDREQKKMRASVIYAETDITDKQLKHRLED